MKVVQVDKNKHYRTFENVKVTSLFKAGGDSYFYIKTSLSSRSNALSLSTGIILSWNLGRMVTYYPDAVIHAGEPE